MDLYEQLKKALKTQIEQHALSGQNISIRCKALSASEAIGNPEHDDYPIIKGREVMVEADFKGMKGQAFTDAFEQTDYLVDELVTMDLNTNRKRASFIAGLNALYRYLDLCDKTIHCKDKEPKDCAAYVAEAIGNVSNVLLVGHQPRFLEMLSSQYNVRAVDIDQDNIGSEFSGVIIEPPEKTAEAVSWCDLIFATGSTIVNGTITEFIANDKPSVFYGVTIAAAAIILNLNRFCQYGH